MRHWLHSAPDRRGAQGRIRRSAETAALAAPTPRRGGAATKFLAASADPHWTAARKGPVAGPVPTDQSGTRRKGQGGANKVIIAG